MSQRSSSNSGKGKQACGCAKCCPKPKPKPKPQPDCGPDCRQCQKLPDKVSLCHQRVEVKKIVEREPWAVELGHVTLKFWQPAPILKHWKFQGARVIKCKDSKCRDAA